LKKLYLIPVPISETESGSMPPHITTALQDIDLIIAEKSKTARKFLKQLSPRPISEFEVIDIDEIIINKKVNYSELSNYEKVGIMSESGCPCVADPGYQIVLEAHQNNVEVIPLVGPSSIILALMASGMNGQNFAFNGYLSAKKDLLDKELKSLETRSLKYNQTEIFIETPYRNIQMIESMKRTLLPNTKVCIACDLTGKEQYITTKTIQNWKKTDTEFLKDKIAIFLMG
jgi:16S rRNA (cytidine1402-2'-O)-methyltransferase